MSDETNELLRELIQLQREHVMEYRAVTKEQLDLLSQSIALQSRIALACRIITTVVVAFGLLVIMSNFRWSN